MTQQSITRQTITHVSKSVAPRMREAGFRRQGNHFHRRSEELIHCINFQASRWGTSEEGSFTINLVVTSEWLYQAWFGTELPANPATALFPVQQRIGSLMPGRRDHWWKVTGSTDYGAVAAEVEEALACCALPFFEMFAGTTAVLERLRSGRGCPGLAVLQIPLVHAIVAARAGFRAEAEARLAHAAQAAGDSPFAGLSD